MTKTTTRKTASEVGGLKASLTATEWKIDAAEAALRTLAGNSTLSAGEVIGERNRLTAEIANLTEELALLGQRLEAARLDDAKRAHTAKIAHVSLILNRRLGHIEAMDAALEQAAECAREIKRIDHDELAADIASVDLRFTIQRGEWQIVASILMASLGLGTDKRMDRTVPSMTVTDFSKGQQS